MTRRIFLRASITMAAIVTAAESNERSARMDDAWDILRSLSQSRNMQNREFAAAGYSLLAQRNSRALKLAIGILDSDSDPEVRAFAASALGEEKCRRAIPALKKALNDSGRGVAFAAAKALLDMDDRAGRTVFQEVLLSERKPSEGMIAGYLEDAKHKMHDPKQLAIIGVNQAVGSFFGPAGMLLSIAEQNLKDKGAPGRALAASAFSSDRSIMARKTLESALQDSSPLVRASACRSLAILGYTSAIPFIEPLLDDKGEAARGMAAAAYIRLRETRVR